MHNNNKNPTRGIEREIILYVLHVVCVGIVSIYNNYYAIIGFVLRR